MAQGATISTEVPGVRRLGVSHPLVVAAFLAIVAFILRAPQFGNPVAGFDEQLYLLIGERMWDGAIPYLDLWDRKPPGLFALFAAMSAFGNGLIVSQIIATLFAAATAWIVFHLAAKRTATLPAILAAFVYLVFLRQLAGQTTQTPVFYNLFLGVAALAILHVARNPRDIRFSAAAMLLCGLAIQLKPTAAIEGAWFGLFLLALHWRAGLKPPAIAARAALYIVAGLLPSLIAAAAYARIGAFDAFWFANVESILLRQESFNALAAEQLLVTLIRGGPALAVGLAGLVLALRADRSASTILLTGWATVAIIEVAILGSFWPHYLLPVLLPLSILAAHVLARGWIGLAVFAVVAAPPLVSTLTRDAAVSRMETARAHDIAAAIPAEVRDQCLFVYEGFTALYSLTHACPVTRYVFTDHLRSSRDGPALGVDPHAELARALARRPLAIVTLQNSPWQMRNVANDRLIAETLARDYRLEASFQDIDPDQPNTRHQIWVRR
ncbi:ArnT family glycosyltransferase [Sphingomonas sp. LT1P40]|uniref:ArnT family glycosyltransferase n=1 Tax=Alteristakelama amylovorans TaxID=3096166 RepID=UPI002FCC15BB